MNNKHLRRRRRCLLISKFVGGDILHQVLFTGGGVILPSPIGGWYSKHDFAYFGGDLVHQQMLVVIK